MDIVIKAVGEVDPRGGFQAVALFGDARIVVGNITFETRASAEEAAINIVSNRLTRIIAGKR